jgi:hypothetical protein
MNQALDRLASEVRLLEPENERLRLSFGYAYAMCIRRLLDQPSVIECLNIPGQYLLQQSCAVQSRTRYSERLSKANTMAARASVHAETTVKAVV